MRPHILDSLYAGLCADAPPRGTSVFEITRFCLDRHLSAVERRAVRDTLVCALVDHALAHGIALYTAIAELGWFQQILAFGWRCRPLGLPQMIDGTMLAALSIEIAPDTPALLRSEEHTSELQSLMRISYAVFCLKKKTKHDPLPI